MLRRVIALLVAFALLAERAAGLSTPLRWFVFWILRRAETAAVDFVFERTGIPPVALEGMATFGNDPADAPRLAARFRALAAALCALLPVEARLARRRSACGHTASGAIRRLGGWTRKPYDTS